MTAPQPQHALPLHQLLGLTADAVQAVMAGKSLTEVLQHTIASARPGVQALSFHVLRCWGSAQHVRAALAPKNPPPKVDALLTTALALLWPVNEPPYAEHTLVDQAVKAVRQRTPAAASFVNAVLRRFLRERVALVQAARAHPVAAFNHPTWWIEAFKRDWPTQWQALLTQANEHPPMTLRVNKRRSTGADYLSRLAAQGITATLLTDAALGGQAIELHQPCAVQLLPGFAQGDVSVQDAAAQRAALLLLGAGQAALPPGARVLDACAAPGGKTAHMLELAELNLLALDSDATRLQRVQENLARLQLQAELKAGDARHSAHWWDGRPFDAILLDAPCSASGISRRHPDVRWLRRASDVANLAQTQSAILESLWPLLKPGGRLLYATCSLFKAEGQEPVDAFLQRHGSHEVRLDTRSPGHLLPRPHNGSAIAAAGAPPAQPASSPDGSADGFFYALLEKLT
jgi:16S rRNA (cytosine967-C5)-methyltransferase